MTSGDGPKYKGVWHHGIRAGVNGNRGYSRNVLVKVIRENHIP